MHVYEATTIRNYESACQSTSVQFGDAVKEVILFGSYARNEAQEDSDIDVMVLLDLPREQLPAHRKQIAHIA